MSCIAPAGDHEAAFARYEQQLRGFLRNKQKAALRMADFFAPSSRLSLKIRDWAIAAASFPPLAKLIAGRTVRDDFELPDYEPARSVVQPSPSAPAP